MRIEIDTSGLFNKLLWMLIAAVITFCGKKVNDISNNIAELNMKMTQVVSWQGQVTSWQLDKSETIKDHELRIRLLEKNHTHAPLENR